MTKIDKERGIAIITGIAKTADEVKQTFTKDQLNQLLELFGLHPSDGETECNKSYPLVPCALSDLNDMSECFIRVFPWLKSEDDDIAESIMEAFPWLKSAIDRGLLD